MNIPEIINVPVASINIDSTNPNKMPEPKFNALKKNIEKYGFLVPIITNKDFVVADGEHRFKAALDLGMSEVPVVKLDINEVDRHIIRQVMNKLKGEHDSILDDVDYKWIYDNEGFDDFKELMAITDREEVKFLANIMPKDEESFDVDKSVKEPKYVVKQGDLWALGGHRLLCGDSTDKSSINALMGVEKATMCFTDPPYNVNYGTFKGGPGDEKRFKQRTIKNDNMTRDDFIKFVDSFINNIIDYSNGPIYLCMSCKEWATVMKSFEDHGGHWSSTIIWNKSTFVLSRKDYHPKFEPILYGWKEGNKIKHLEDRNQSDVWDFDKPYNSELHPTMKPIELCSRAIINSSEPDNIVLDLFGGSGSTLIACEQTKRQCFMMEIDPVYCSVIIERFINLVNSEEDIWKIVNGKKIKLQDLEKDTDLGIKE